MINKVLGGLLWIEVMVYLDDIVIAGKTWKRHLQLVDEVFKRLASVGLMLKPHFFKNRVKVLVFTLS